MEALGVALVAAALMLGVATPADARGDMTFEFAALAAQDYWSERGVSLPCAPTVRVLTEAENAALQPLYIEAYGAEFAMFADRERCQVGVSPYAEWLRTDRDLSWIYCAGIVHEFGHLAGLEHAYGGVMDGAVPFGCAHPRQWAVLQGWRRPPRWVRRSPARVQRLWLAGRVWKAQAARARWLERRGQ